MTTENDFNSKLHLVYVIGTYPLLTTTFIDREIKTLRKEGVDLQVISVRKPPASMPLSPEQIGLQRGVNYLLPADVLELFQAHSYYAFHKPRKYFGTLAYLLSRPHPNLAARWKTLLHFGQGVFTAYQLRNKLFQEIHAHFLDRAATIALVAGRLLDVPYSLSIHAGADIYVHPVLIREKLGHARKAVTCTAYNKRHLETLLDEDLSEKLTCIPHGLDGSFYMPRAVVSPDKDLILSVGQLAERKGYRYLIEACHLLRKQSFDFECQIIGDGPLRQELKELIENNSLGDNIKLTGALPHNQVMERYRRATIFVMPCVQTAEGDVDGIPNVLLEAMAMQVPVISTQISAIPELIQHEWNGLLVSPNDVDGLTRAILRLLSDRDLRAKIGLHGRESVLANFDVDTNIHQLFNTLWPNRVLSEEKS